MKKGDLPNGNLKKNIALPQIGPEANAEEGAHHYSLF